ncbi:MAG: 6-phosphogluconolactonase [Chloroflexi bacterium OLB14]|nr:MAG: 6-phosphogluconolactonase [Chloroflexi bacterium OLB14]
MMIKEFSVDEIVKDLIQIANESIEKRGRFLISLAGGNTPIKIYKKLADANLDWSRVHFFGVMSVACQWMMLAIIMDR